jgi:hypothetical protein
MPREEARSFKYKPRSREDIKERANMRGGNFDSIFKSKFKLYKVRDGKNLIRILPPTWDSAKHYGLDLWVNYNVGADNQSYLSLSMMKGEADPLAEAKKQAEREGDKELAAALKPRQRILMWIIDRQAEDEGPQLFSCPFTLDKALANLSFDEDTKEILELDNDEEGCDVRFYKEGSGLKTDYPAEKIKIFDKSPLCDDQDLQDEWLDFVVNNPLPSVLEYHDYDHINNTFNGQVGSRAEKKDEDEDKPRTRRGRDSEDEKTPFDGGTRRRRTESEDEEKPRSTRREKVTEEEDEAEPEKSEEKPRSSIRDRLRERRQTAETD